MQRCQRGVDGRQEVCIDRSQTTLIDIGFGAAGSKFKGLIGAYV